MHLFRIFVALFWQMTYMKYIRKDSTEILKLYLKSMSCDTQHFHSFDVVISYRILEDILKGKKKVTKTHWHL